MNLHALRVFHRVAQLGSFSRAADALCISQPAVSKALKELEHQLGMQLIARASRGKKLALTEGGQSLFNHAKSIFAIEQAALEDVRARTGLKQGTLVLGASTTIAGYWLAPYLARFTQQYPHIKVEVQVANTAQIEQALLACTIDLALVEGHANDSHISSQHWQDDPMSIVIPGSLTAIGDKANWLSQQRWLLREPGSGTRQMSFTLLAKQGITVNDSMQLGSNEAIARAVTQGLGVALLPQVVTEDLVQLNKLKVISTRHYQMLSRPLYQLRYRDRPSSPAADAFTTLLYQPLA
ncbi:LysR substrate-binding domain-containing protein [Aliiglaciecola sp. 2_MG-2023]|uniref:LysR family transcriptional regulator n=1 Tax=unclassified Aliiglaciecola TaxID=2593648 RepID=UPI0026E2A6E2|nr:MULTISPECIES: LysR substrate-binding domain-containing protein [unclassified Aliiglaciecola]MDO6713205.1 LysR substrate-binding domain-containing protein [Aliiglaciecola sp. 2_MG-2023]MDO6754309.1 LysR substrate-binding domain-containing protein [Aliiglaciecola sp. 1_MG-2023]